MNKLDKIRDAIHGEPVLYDYYCYEREWTTGELNQLMMAEYLTDIEELAMQMNRSYYAVVLKYLEVRGMLDGKLAFDVKLWEGQQQASSMYQFENDWNVDEYTKDVSVASMKVGEIIEVLVRIVDPELRENIPNDLDDIWVHFMTAHDGGGGLFGGTRITCLGLTLSEQDPDKWGILRFMANKAGTVQIGMAIKNEASEEYAVSKTMLINIKE